ncbi:MAG: serine peptidase [Gammaproteobacteria bacterium]|nr:MAG: serine peptidase [Gammaproteobacteria bacterium]
MRHCSINPFKWRALLLVGILLSQGVFFTSNVWAGRLPDFTQLVESNASAVVNIATVQKPKKSKDSKSSPQRGEAPEIFRHFFGDGAEPRQKQRESLGSGFIISKDGYILTNNHVVQGADEVIIRLNDRREFTAEVVGMDSRSDLALLKIDAGDLPSVVLGDSKKLKVGEWVLAIGSPFGFDYSVTAGIVSALGRNLPRDSYVPFIQTDVAINPGNSGGPLFNLEGEVVGINSQIYSRTGGFMGLSFAIPIDVAMDVVDQLKAQGYVDRGWLGVLIQEISRGLAESFGLEKPSGALVAKVLPDSPAYDGGLQAGDVILSFDGVVINKASDLPPIVGRTKVGSVVSLQVMRDGKEIEKQLTIRVLPDDASVAGRNEEKKASPEKNRLAIVVSDLTKAQLSRWDVKHGVVVNTVYAGAARDAGLRPGDIITELNNRSIQSVKSFEGVLDALPKGKTVPMLVSRRGNPMFLALKVE